MAKSEKKGGGGTGHPNSLKNLEKGKWPKGTSGNPKGPPKKILTRLREAIGMDSDEKIGATLTISEYKDVALWLMELTQDELKKVILDKQTPAFVVIIARGLQRDMGKGTMFAFDNVFGKFLEEKEQAPTAVIFSTGFDLGENEPEPTDDESDEDKLKD